MLPKRRSATATAPAKKTKHGRGAALTPKEAHFQRLNKARDDNGCLGSMLVVGVNSDDEKEDDKEYTAEQMAQLRHILINESRDKALTAADKFVTVSGSGLSQHLFAATRGCSARKRAT